MIKVTYLITVYNKERYIAKVIESLKAIKGNFGKEFIFIDDGSTDLSLEIVKKNTTSLKNTIIVTQQNQGPAIALNKGISLARGDYVFFLDGDDIIEADATLLLLQSANDLGTAVALGKRGKYDAKTGERFAAKKSKIAIKDRFLITNPLSALLEAKIPRIRTIGSSGSLVKLELLRKIGGSDPNVFVQDFSLSLKCALHSNFAYVNKEISFEPLSYDDNNLSHNTKFESYNSLQALANFIQNNKQIAEQYKVELYKALWSIMWKLNKNNLGIFYKYILSKYFKPQITIQKLLTLYQNNIMKLS